MWQESVDHWSVLLSHSTNVNYNTSVVLEFCLQSHSALYYIKGSFRRPQICCKSACCCSTLLQFKKLEIYLLFAATLMTAAPTNVKCTSCEWALSWKVSLIKHLIRQFPPNSLSWVVLVTVCNNDEVKFIFLAESQIRKRDFLTK